jgi:hypothetical protein
MWAWELEIQDGLPDFVEHLWKENHKYSAFAWWREYFSENWNAQACVIPLYVEYVSMGCLFVCFYRQIYVTHKKFQCKYHTNLGTQIPKYLPIIVILSHIGFLACKMKIYGLKEKKEKLQYF